MTRADRPLTFTERARRQQLIEVTVGLVADHGYAKASLGRIAERAGITKAAVLYHYASKDELVRAARDQVLGELVAEVGAAVESARPAEAPAAYIRTMVRHLREHPRHTRMITEAIANEDEDRDTRERWGPLAGLLDVAVGDGAAIDSRALAIIIGGAIDGIVAERLHDPTFDSLGAAEVLVGVVTGALASTRRR